MPGRPSKVDTPLPKNYRSLITGVFIKIHWTIRVRVFLADGQEMVGDLPFRLGSLSDVRTVKPT